jgi:CDP-diacylglycerol--glycerol-3-phosphate 3-phosphatidyltransferase
MKKKKEENIWNIPNTLTLIRVFVTLLIVYFIIGGYDVKVIVSLFLFGMLTDFLDGQIARRFNQTTEFGRKFDMIADRFLLIGTMIAVLINLFFIGQLTQNHLMQFIMIMSREIIALPVAIIAITSRKRMPNARFVGKLTTTLQAFAFPSILLSVYYTFFSFSFYLAALTSVVGVISGFTYISDVLNMENK